MSGRTANTHVPERVILDFQGVLEVGQGFADEVLRVWQRAHPDIRIETRNMIEPVEFMVRRALARGGSL